MGYSNMLIEIYTAAGVSFNASDETRSEHLKSVYVPQDACLYATANGIMCRVNDTKYLIYEYDRPHIVWGLGLSHLSTRIGIYIERNLRNGAPEYSIGEVINLSTLNRSASTDWNGKLFLYELTPICGKWTIDWTKLPENEALFGWGEDYTIRGTRSQNVNFDLYEIGPDGNEYVRNNFYELQTCFLEVNDNGSFTTGLVAMGMNTNGGITRTTLAEGVVGFDVTITSRNQYDVIDFGTEEQLVSLEFYQWLSTFATQLNPVYKIKLLSQYAPDAQLASFETSASTTRLFIYRDKITDAHGRVLYVNKSRGADIKSITYSYSSDEPTYTWIDGFKAAVQGIPSTDVGVQDKVGYYYVDPSTLSIGDVYVDKTTDIAYAAVKRADDCWHLVESEACGYSLDTILQADPKNEVNIYVIKREVPVYYTIRSETLKRIANAIRSKTERTEPIMVEKFADEINSILTYKIESDQLNDMLKEVFG